MGLRGSGARPKQKVATAASRHRTLPWKKKGLSRVERVIAFLEFTPITKGILVGKKMKLLPGQRQFIEAVYGRVSEDRRRKTASRSRASRAVMENQVCLPVLHCVTCWGLRLNQ